MLIKNSRQSSYANVKRHQYTRLIRQRLSALVCAFFLLGSQANAQSIASDDFDRANLDSSRWTFINPLDDGWVAMTGTNTSDAYLELSVPAGVSHDPWQALNRSVRVMQTVTDGDFEIDTRFASEPDPNQTFQLQGIMVEEDNDNWLRFNLQSNGGTLRLFAGSTVNGSSTPTVDLNVNPGEAGYLRVNRDGDNWIFSYSADGVTWLEAGNFTRALLVSSVGPFVANHGSGGASPPAYTAQVDYFFNSAAPVVDDDGAEPDIWVPLIHTFSTLGSGTSLTINWYTDEPSIGAVDFGPTTAYGTTETEVIPVYFHTVTITGLIPGNTYNYQIRSEDDINQEATSQNFEVNFDPAGPTIDVWYGDTQDFGLAGNPQEFFINIPGNVSDPDGVSSLSYTLDGGTSVNLTIGPDNRRLENAGDFNIDPDWTGLSDGAHTVEITAMDNGGNSTIKTVTLNYTGGNVWSFPYTADWSLLTTDSDPATPDPAIQTLAQVVDGKWSVDNGVIRTVEPGYDRLVALGDHLSDDYEALVPITINGTTGSFGVGLLFRWNGHTDTPVSCVQPECGYLPLGAIGWFRSNRIEFFDTGVTQAFSISIGTTYWMRMRVENSGANPVYYLKVWEDGQTEPLVWNLTHTEDTGSVQTGSLLLISHEADVSFGTVVITPVQGGPNMLPVAMGDNRSVITGESVVIDVLSNDSDSDGSLVPGTVTVVGAGPINGSIDSINPTTGAITYTHNGSATSTDSFDYTVEDNDGDVSNVATVNIAISNNPPPVFVSDDFCAGTLDPVWTYVNPQSDGTLGFSGASTSNAWLELSVPAGPEHQVWTSGIQAPHVIQAADNTDFELEVKFESPVNAPQYQEQGVVIKQDDFNFLRFEIYSTNTSTTGLSAVLQSTTSSFPLSSTIFANVAIEPLNTAPIYVRVKRTGNLWTHSYSIDGINFSNIGSPFSHSLTVSGVGIYGASGSGVNSPAHTAKFDYLENLADPIANEDACAPVAYSATYDGNGNDGGVAPVDGNSPYLSGSTATVLGSGNLSLTGHDFAGWNTQSDGLGTQYVPGAMFTITADTTLYAQWLIDQHTVGYNGNGNDGGSAPADPGSPYIYNATVTVIGSGDLSLAGHSFAGWNTQADGLGMQYAPGAMFTITADTVLFAQWLIDLHSVSYDGNGNDSGTEPVDASSPYNYNATVTVPAAGDLSLTGNSFAGWNTQADGLGTQYAPGAMFTITADTTLYAQWLIDLHTISYDGNGNDGGTEPVDASSPYNYNATVTVLGAGGLSLTGHSFSGWNTQSDGLGTQYAPGAMFTITVDMTLHAQWINMPPVAGDDEATTLEDMTVDVFVLSNDSDEETETLSIVTFDSTSVEGGSVSQNVDDSLTYEPAPDFFGNDNFTYTISDGFGGEDTGKVSIEVLRDTDGDGVPNDTDTDDDDDGMLDLYEINNSLDPLVDDFDQDDDLDEISNGIESLVGTDPQSDESLPEGPGGAYVFFRDDFDNELFADRWVASESHVSRAPATLLETSTEIQIQIPQPLDGCDNARLESFGAIDVTTGVYRARFAYDASGEAALGLQLDALTRVEVRLNVDNSMLSLVSSTDVLSDTQNFATSLAAGEDILLRLVKSGSFFNLYANGRFQGSAMNEGIGDLGLRPYIEAQSCADDNGPVDTRVDIVEVLADNDGDGLADTFEDTNGDGIVDVVGLGGLISIGETAPLDADSDGDTVPDGDDNCSLADNFDQRDSDDDLYGNLCDPDLTNDGIVNFDDLNLMRDPFFGSDENADLNGDGIVNFGDLDIMRVLFFIAPGPSGPLGDL